MADQLRTTEADLTARAFPLDDWQRWPAYALGRVLQAPLGDLPTAEDLAREQGQIGLPSETQTALETGQAPLDYVAQFLGPLLALLGSQQYARTKEGNPARAWGARSPYTKANSPLEQLRNWRQTQPWQDKPPMGESAWQYRNPPPIGGPTGRGMSKPDILAAIEKEQFQGMLKKIRDLEAQEAARAVPPPLDRGPGQATRRPAPGQQIDDDQLDWMIQQMWKQGGADPGGPFKPPPLPGG